jgi:hypothetical protein
MNEEKVKMYNAAILELDKKNAERLNSPNTEWES